MDFRHLSRAKSPRIDVVVSEASSRVRRSLSPS